MLFLRCKALKDADVAKLICACINGPGAQIDLDRKGCSVIF